MQIPKVIHQTWKDENIPAVFRKMSKTWEVHHPGWEHHIWTDAMNREFIRKHFPYFLECYDRFPANIQRVDAVRYFVLYKYGGVYVDLDFECRRSFTSLLSDATCVFGTEPAEHCRIHDKDMIISNAFMAAVPGHDFFASLCRELESDDNTCDHKNNHILETTGPFMLTRVYQRYHHKTTVKILDAGCIYPLTKDELAQAAEEGAAGDTDKRLQQAYAVHHYAGTWWKQPVTGALPGNI